MSDRRSDETDADLAEEAEDLLGRAEFAQMVASELATLDFRHRGGVIGVTGSWGSGKTFVLELIKERLVLTAGHTVADYNAWHFADADDIEVSVFKKIALDLRAQSGSLIAVADSFSSHAAAGSRQGNAAYAARVLARDLAALAHPLAVFVDDLDRLSPAALLRTFEAVRAVALLPNVVYVLAFDQAWAEAALTGQGANGSLYLEQTVQRTYRLPDVPIRTIKRRMAEAERTSKSASERSQFAAPQPIGASLHVDAGLALLDPLTVAEYCGVERLLQLLWEAAAQQTLTEGQEAQILAMARLVEAAHREAEPGESQRWRLVAVVGHVLRYLYKEWPKDVIVWAAVGKVLADINWHDLRQSLPLP